MSETQNQTNPTAAQADGATLQVAITTTPEHPLHVSIGRDPDDPKPSSTSEEIGNLLDLVIEQHFNPFIDQPDRVVLWMPDGELCDIRSRRFQAWATSEYWEVHEETPSRKAWDQFLLLLESQAWDRRRDAIALNDYTLLKLILAVVEQRGELNYSVLTLCRSLHERATQAAKAAIPQSPAALGRKLAQLTPALRKAGYEVAQLRTSQCRKWSIRRITTTESVIFAAASHDARDDGMTRGDGKLTAAEIEAVIEKPFHQKEVKEKRDGSKPGAEAKSANESPAHDEAHETPAAAEESDADRRRREEKLDAMTEVLA